jgi:NAD(P)-dependent dehydrogenase (short-subunit alcohol dehydrogenase family)
MILTPIWDYTSEEQRALAASQAPVARMGEPEEVAAAICFLASDDASFVNGVELLVDGGWCATRSLHGPDGVLQPSL